MSSTTRKISRSKIRKIGSKKLPVTKTENQIHYEAEKHFNDQGKELYERCLVNTGIDLKELF